MSSATIPDGQATARRQKLRKLAAAARAVALIGIALVIGYQGYLLFNPKLMISSLNIDAWPADISPSNGAQILAWVLTLLPSALFVAAMLDVRTLFALLARGSIFDPEISHLLRRIGQIAVAAALVTFVVRTLIVLVITMGSPGSPHFVIGITSEEITALVVGLLLLAFALVMQEVIVVEEEKQELRLTMSIVVNLDVVLARRKMRSKELAERIGITEQNVSLLKSGKVKGIRFDTLAKICAVLDCQPGDIIEFVPDR